MFGKHHIEILELVYVVYAILIYDLWILRQNTFDKF